MVVQLDGIRSSSEKRVSRFEGVWDGTTACHEVLDLWIFLLEVRPLALPHLHNLVAFGLEHIDFLFGLIICPSHIDPEKTLMCFCALWVTSGTSMPVTAMEFVDGVRGLIVTIGSVAGLWNLEFPGCGLA